MKNIILSMFIVTSCFSVQAQNPPVVEKGAPQSNNTLPRTTLNSNSGVNPQGNPGTIISNTANSTNTTTVAPNPNVEPGTFLTSAPEGTVIVATAAAPNKPIVQQTAIVTTSTGSGTQNTIITNVDAVTTTASNTGTVTTTKISPASSVAVKKTQSAKAIDKPVLAVKQANALPAYSPVLGNFIPTETINNIKKKYGGSVYDIRTVKVFKTNKIAYIVRIVDNNGALKDELFYDE